MGAGTIVFKGWDDGTAATTEYSGIGIGPADRVMIAVAGVVAQHLAGNYGFISPQPHALDVFLPASGPVPEEVRGDFQSIQDYGPQIYPQVSLSAALQAGVTAATGLLEGLGGAALIAQISLSVAVCLGKNDRARWRHAVEWHVSAVYTETLFYPDLKTIGAADPALAAGAAVLRGDIEAGRRYRRVPSLPQ